MRLRARGSERQDASLSIYSVISIAVYWTIAARLVAVYYKICVVVASVFLVGFVCFSAILLKDGIIVQSTVQG